MTDNLSPSLTSVNLNTLSLQKYLLCGEAICEGCDDLTRCEVEDEPECDGEGQGRQGSPEYCEEHEREAEANLRRNSMNVLLLLHSLTCFKF